MLVKCVTTLDVQMASDSTEWMVLIVKTLLKCESVIQVQRHYGRDCNVPDTHSRNCVMKI
jgi:hypothetical protein